MTSAKPIKSSIELFVSYSHRDERLKNQLDDHLSLLKRQGVLTVWHDRMIAPGTEWSEQIDDNLNRAQLVLLLVSANFLASDYCFGIEMQRALERHRAGLARVIPIILRPVDWERAPFGVLQALPTNAKPVVKWKLRDEAFKDITDGIRRALGELKTPDHPISSPEPPSLTVFLCHDSGDKPAVRRLYHDLVRDGFQPWLDEESLLPGQDWDSEIRRAVRGSHVVVVCLSRRSVTRGGYIQKEIKFALDVAEEQPEGTIFLIPLRLEDCDVPDRFRTWHLLNLFNEGGYEKLVRALRVRASTLQVAFTQTPRVMKSYRDALHEREAFLKSFIPEIYDCDSTRSLKVERFVLDEVFGRPLGKHARPVVRECLVKYLIGRPRDIGLVLFGLFSELESFLRKNLPDFVSKTIGASLKEVYAEVGVRSDNRHLVLGELLRVYDAVVRKSGHDEVDGRPGYSEFVALRNNVVHSAIDLASEWEAALRTLLSRCLGSSD